MIPYISNSYDYTLVDLYVVAQDKYASTVNKNMKLKVTNNFDSDKTIFAVLSDFKNLLQNGSISEPYY
jgi:predicted ATP-grasp superfamily ATP-dependent carboligase